MHRLTKLKHDVVGKIGKQIDAAHAAVEQTDSHVNRAYLACYILYSYAAISVTKIRLSNVDRKRRQIIVLGNVYHCGNLQRCTNECCKFTGNSVMTPEVRTVCERLVVYFKDDVIDSIE